MGELQQEEDKFTSDSDVFTKLSRSNQVIVIIAVV